MPAPVPSFDRSASAARSLQGLSVGDALGAQFFVPDNRTHFQDRTTPAPPWPWTDDTQMAAVLLDHLREHGHIRQDALAASFAAAFDLYRGYGPGAARMLRLVRDGGDWRELSTAMFDGAGSLGNGAAMRVPPLGAWFADDLDAVAAQARLSAVITHAHPEGVSGAIAVAVATALAVRGELDLHTVVDRTPPGPVRDGVSAAAGLPADVDADTAARLLGNGSRPTAAETVPYCLWAAARHRDDFAAAFWTTVSTGGDVDTTAAIVGGITAAGGAPVPDAWIRGREALT